MKHEMKQDRTTAPPPAEALTDAPQKKKPWAKPTIRDIDDGGIDSVLAGTDKTLVEFGIDNYSPTS